MKPGWLAIARAGLNFMRLVRVQTAQECSCEKCPLQLNKKAEAAARKMSQNEMIKRQIELYRRNHLNG